MSKWRAMSGPGARDRTAAGRETGGARKPSVVPGSVLTILLMPLLWGNAAGQIPQGGSPVPPSAASASSGAASATSAPSAADDAPLVQTLPSGAVRDILYARPFTLAQAFPYSFLRDQPAIRRGFLLVLSVDPEAAVPREVDVPVLYAGDTPVHLTNTGASSGHLVILVPDWVDLARDPVYFGSMELPERVDRARGARERAAAIARGARPFEPVRRAAAFEAGGPALHAVDSVQLFLAVADLIDRFAPEEAELARNLRTPVIGR